MEEIKILTLDNIKDIISEQIPDAFKEKKKVVKKAITKKAPPKKKA